MDDGSHARAIPRILECMTALPTVPVGEKPPAPDLRQPFLADLAIKSGALTRKQLRSSSYRPLFQGIHLATAVPFSQDLRVRAALTPFGETARASHLSAARVHRLPLPIVTSEVEYVVVPKERERRRINGIECLVRRGDVTTVRGLQVSPVEQTFAELAEILPLVDLVVIADHLVFKRRSTPDGLLAASVGSPGARRAREALALARQGVESPMETRLRLLMVFAGLPEPAINLSVDGKPGQRGRRYDLSYPDVKVAIEYDGKAHVETIENWESDLLRREAIDNDGWRLVVITSKGIYTRPDQTLERIVGALRAAGMRVPRLVDTWQAYFPVR